MAWWGRTMRTSERRGHYSTDPLSEALDQRVGAGAGSGDILPVAQEPVERAAAGPQLAMGFVSDSDEKSFRLIGQTPTVPTDKEMDVAALAKVERQAAAVNALVSQAQVDAQFANPKLTEAERPR